jgi:hypothetical protein
VGIPKKFFVRREDGKIRELGTLSLNVDSEGVATAKEVTGDIVMSNFFCFFSQSYFSKLLFFLLRLASENCQPYLGIVDS